MSNKVKAMIAVMSAVIALCLVAAGYLAFRTPLAAATSDCMSLKTIANEDEVEMNRHVPGSDAYRTAEKVYQDSLDAYNSCAGNPTPTPVPTEPAAPPADDPTNTGDYSCRPLSVFDLPGKSGSRSLAPRQGSDLNEAIAQEKRWAWCDSAILVEYAIHYQVNGLEGLKYPQDQDLAIKLRDQALAGNHAEWDALYAAYVAQVDASQRSIGHTEANRTYWSRQGMPDASGVVGITDVRLHRDREWSTLDTVLPNGTRVQKRLECDQFQVKEERHVKRSPILREEIPRDDEATPVVKKDKPKKTVKLTNVCRKVDGKWETLRGVVRQKGDLDVDDKACKQTPPPKEESKQISVCRDSLIIKIKESDKRATDTEPFKGDNGRWICSKEQAPQPDKVKKPVDNSPAPTASASPAPKKEPLKPNPTPAPSSSPAPAPRDGNKAEQPNQGGSPGATTPVNDG